MYRCSVLGPVKYGHTFICSFVHCQLSTNGIHKRCMCCVRVWVCVCSLSKFQVRWKIQRVKTPFPFYPLWISLFLPAFVRLIPISINLNADLPVPDTNPLCSLCIVQCFFFSLSLFSPFFIHIQQFLFCWDHERDLLIPYMSIIKMVVHARVCSECGL